VDGLASDVCPASVESPMLGVFVKEVTYPGRITDVMRSAITPVGTGAESAQIRYDVVAGPDSALEWNVETLKPRNVQAADRQLPIDSSGSVAGINPGGRADITRKGSVLVWPRVEVKWDAAGRLLADTVLTLTNDSPEAVDVQLYLVNGDAPLDAECLPTCRLVYGDACVSVPGCLVERSHPGWNNSDVQIPLTGNQPTYWSAFSGQPAGASSLIVLDPGLPPGRPDLDPRNLGGRVIRGFIVGWAVNADGEEVCWNHLTGSAMLIHYGDRSAAEYNAWAVQCVSGVAQGAAPDAFPGQLNFDGMEYEWIPDALTFDFYAVGSQVISHPELRR
jgi:hypothetical protein